MASGGEIRRIYDVSDEGIRALVDQSDVYLSGLYPPESNHAEPLAVLTAPGSAFFAIYEQQQPVACGAVKLVGGTPPYAEIKRVFVDEAMRGKGLAVAIMAHLEAFAVEQDVSVMRLEAGPKQPEAIGLYRKLGYQNRGPFGPYRDDPLSIFMEKRLTVSR
ncbi:MAG: GNAT family N-acetyltransferase [Pseudomonadota bacterium]